MAITGDKAITAPIGQEGLPIQPVGEQSSGELLSTIAKTCRVFFQKLGVILLAPILFTVSIAFNVCTLGIPFIINAIHIKRIQTIVESNKHSVMDQSLNVKVTEEQTITQYLECQDLKTPGRDLGKNFLCEIKGLVLAIEHGKKSSEIRRIAIRISKKYDALFKNADADIEPAVKFLGIVSAKLLGGGFDGSKRVSPFQTYGKELVGESGDLSCSQLYDRLVGIGNAHLAVRRDGCITSLFWTLLHPSQAITNLWHLIAQEKVNQCDENPTDFLFEYQKQDDPSKKFTCIVGPCPLNDTTYQTCLRFMNSNGLKEYRSNLQKLKGKEAQAFHGLRKLSQTHQNLCLASTPVDNSLTKKTKKEKGSPLDLNAFFNELRDHYKQSSEIGECYIDGKFLDAQKVASALDKAEEVFNFLSTTTSWKRLAESSKGRQRLSALIVACTQSIIRVHVIDQALETAESSDDKDPDLACSRLAVACKKGLDRGVMGTILDKIFFKFLNRDPQLGANPLIEEKRFSKEEVQTIIGTIFGRSYLVEGRMIMKKRFLVITDLLECLGNPEQDA